MSQWAEIRNDFYSEEEGKVYIDAWLTDDSDEEGEVIAKINYKTKEIEYIEDYAKYDPYAQEVINETLKSIDDGDFELCD